MNPWLETIAVMFIALLGIVLGWLFSISRKPCWLLGYFLSFALIAVLVLARFTNSLAFIPPFSWLVAGRIKFVVLSLAVTTGLVTPLSRLPYRFEKVMIGILIVIVVTWFSVLPFLVPALIEDSLLSIETVVDSDGICLQSRDYTCGPAAAVTALRILGLPANEGRIAVLSHSSPIVGTLPDCLSAALRSLYVTDGLKCQYRHFDSLEQLKGAGITLAVVRNAFLLDHCVVVLEVSDDMVTVADPVLGKRLISREQFEEIWRFSGIVLKRDLAQSI